LLNLWCQMTVGVDQSDQTWLTHVNGLLALLQKPHNDDLRSLLLYEAIQRLAHPAGLNGDEQDNDLTDTERTFLILEISKLRLKTHITDMEGLLISSDHPRQLDLQKIRGSVTRVYKDLALIPGQLNADNGEFCVLRNSAHN
jgi:hypothetical protein